VGDAREEKLLNGSELQDQSVLLFRTASLELHGAVRAKAEVLHGPTIVQSLTGFRSSFSRSDIK
jgi:hypothetical protein